MGLSELKKLECLFRIAGEEGMFCSVSIALSDNDGIDFLLDACSPNTPGEDVPSSRAKPSPPSRRNGLDEFLKNVSSLALRASIGVDSRILEDVDGIRGFEEVELDKVSRDGAFRRRGLTTLGLEDC